MGGGEVVGGTEQGVKLMHRLTYRLLEEDEAMQCPAVCVLLSSGSSTMWINRSAY